MAELSTLPDLLPWPFLVCSRKGEILFANPLVDRAVGRKVQAGMNIDKLLRAQGAITLSAGAYLAEVVRAGLQTLPRGEYEAADAPGLTSCQKTAYILLPHAHWPLVPPPVHTFFFGRTLRWG